MQASLVVAVVVEETKYSQTLSTSLNWNKADYIHKYPPRDRYLGHENVQPD